MREGQECADRTKPCKQTTFLTRSFFLVKINKNKIGLSRAYLEATNQVLHFPVSIGNQIKSWLDPQCLADGNP